jgi:hypothetical protein
LINILARRLAHAVLYVTPELKIAPADIYSRTDGQAQQFGLDATERFFASSASARSVSRAMQRFLGDPEAERALKKGYHVRQEHRARILALRQDPPFGPVAVPNGRHPIDRTTAKEMVHAGLLPDPFSVQIPVTARVLSAISPWAWAVIFLCKALAVFCFAGGGQERQSSLFASHGFLKPQVFEHLCNAIRASESTDPELEPLTIVNDATASVELDPAIAKCVDAESLRVPRGRWFQLVLAPGLILVAQVLWVAIRHCGDARALLVAALALRQASLVIPVWKIGLNVHFRYFLDIVEYNEMHVLKGIVFRKFGGAIARWPTSSIDSPGSITSYLGYDLFLSSGPYQAENYSATWSPECRSVSVGFLHKDPRFGSGTDVAVHYEQEITRRVDEGKRLIALFGSSDAATQCFGPPMVEMLVRVMEAIRNREDYFVVIKPKGRKGEYLHATLENDSRLRDWISGSRVVSVHYDETDTEVCGAGWLIDKMSVGVGNAGTVMTEALTYARPYIAYYPVIAKTPATEKLRQSGLLHDDLDSFENVLNIAIESPGSIDVPVDWVRQNFDPFDGKYALERVFDTMLNTHPPLQVCEPHA